jgi:DNA polymerase-3 subunit delta'
MRVIIGQPHALDQLQRILRSGRIHHAWIFSGPRGVGKYTCAIELARILLDHEAAPNARGDIEAKSTGHASHLIDAGTHPDLHIIRKELALHSDNPLLRARKLMNIPLDLLRERMLGGCTSDDRMHEAAAYRTARLGHGKVFIVDEAELIDKWGQNTLLKTLEEPPPATYIVLVTSRPERLLPTIRSRCQHIRFGLLDHASMQSWFDGAALDVGAEERAWLERFAEGAPGQALLAAQFRLFEWRGSLAPMIGQLERGGFPAEMGKAMAELVKAFSEAWVKGHRNASKDAANKDGARQLFALLTTYARTRLHEAGTDEARAMLFAGVIDLIRDAEIQLDWNVNPRHVFDNLVAQWSRLALQPS